MAGIKESPSFEMATVNEQPEKQSAYNDESDMRRMGKTQDFQRNFQFLSIAAFSVVAICGWCYIPGTTGTGLTNGGTGGIIVMFLINWFGLAFVVVSLAEMSSMYAVNSNIYKPAPTAGGQYHWASEFAPPRFQRLASYLAGWLSSISWSAGFASGTYIISLTIQGLILVNHPSYVPKPWQAYLLVILISTISFLINTLLARHLPRLEGIVFVYFVAAFISFMVVVWVLAPTISVSEVFGTFSNDSGWSSLGLSMLSGQSAIMFLLVGSDATAHMAEETRDASIVVPKAMVTSYIINGGLSFIVLVTYCFLLVDYSEAVASPAGSLGLPNIQVMINATQSVAGGTALVAITTSLEILALSNWMASTARQVFAFARDKGMPFGHWLSRVDAAGTYPINSLILVWAFVTLLPLITLGSTIAFDALTSLQIISLIFTYMISMTSIIWRRLFGEPLPPSPWTLGRFALPINIMGWMYCVYQVTFLPWPVVMPVTSSNFNWASVMFVGIVSLAVLYYIIVGRKYYKGPVYLVRPRNDI